MGRVLPRKARHRFTIQPLHQRACGQFRAEDHMQRPLMLSCLGQMYVSPEYLFFTLLTLSFNSPDPSNYPTLHARWKIPPRFGTGTSAHASTARSQAGRLDDHANLVNPTVAFIKDTIDVTATTAVKSESAFLCDGGSTPWGTTACAGGVVG